MAAALVKGPFIVVDNGPSFIAQRFTELIRERYSHVRIQYRTAQQLGCLERFHQTPKTDAVYEILYQNIYRYLLAFHVCYSALCPHWVLVQVSHISQGSCAYTLMSDLTSLRRREACVREVSG